MFVCACVCGVGCGGFRKSKGGRRDVSEAVDPGRPAGRVLGHSGHGGQPDRTGG